MRKSDQKTPAWSAWSAAGEAVILDLSPDAEPGEKAGKKAATMAQIGKFEAGQAGKQTIADKDSGEETVGKERRKLVRRCRSWRLSRRLSFCLRRLC